MSHRGSEDINGYSPEKLPMLGTSESEDSRYEAPEPNHLARFTIFLTWFLGKVKE